MHLISNLLAVSVLLGCLVGLVAMAFTEKPLASCTRCHRSFDSLCAWRGHVMDCENR